MSSSDAESSSLKFRSWLGYHVLVMLALFALGFAIFVVVAEKLDNRFAEAARNDHLGLVFKVHLVLLPAYGIMALVHALLSWPVASRRLASRGRFRRLLSAVLWTAGLFALSLGPMSYVGPGSLDNLARLTARSFPPEFNIYVFKTWHLQELFTAIVAGLALWLIVDFLRWVAGRSTAVRVVFGLLGGAAVGLVLLWFWRDSRGVEHRETSAPHILIVGADSLRFDHLSGHGYKRKTSPNIDAILDESIDFQQMHVATASTLESWTSFLTGKWPANHGLRYMFASREQAERIDRDEDTLPRILGREGYESAVVGDWAANCFTLADYGFDRTETSDIQNLDVFLSEVALRTHIFIPHYFSHRVGESVVPMMRQATGFMHPGHLTSRFLDRLDESSERGKPFFGVLFLASPHLPFKVSYPFNTRFTDPEYRGPNRYEVAFDVDDFIQYGFDEEVSEEEKRQITALYDGGVAQFDHEVGRVIDHLKKSGLANNTILIVTSDHGEDLYEPGTTLGHGTNFFGGDQSTRIPFVLRLPGGQLGGRKVEGVVRNIDLLPTVIDLVDAATDETVKAAPAIDGKSLVPLITGKSDDLGRAAFAETCYLFYPKRVPGEDVFAMKPADETLIIDPDFRNLFVLNPKYHDYVIETKDRMMRSNRWKLIHIKGQRGPIWRFYDMLNDPEQTLDLSKVDLPFETPLDAMKEALLQWKETGRDRPWPKENDWPASPLGGN